MEFDKDIINKYKHDYVFFGSSEKYIFTDKNVKGHKIKFWIKANTNCYYVVSVREVDFKNDDSKIGESGFIIKAIKGDDKEKNLMIFGIIIYQI